MSWRKRSLKKSRLYVVIDKKILRGRKLALVAKILRGSGAGVVQLRDKEADKSSVLKDALLLRRQFSASGRLFIINDYADIAKLVNADGVHLGQKDLSLKTARRLLGRDKIIGVSCHNLSQALRAQREGADYIGMGPVFPTGTKRIERKSPAPGLIKAVSKKVRLPVFAIGGITPDNLPDLTAAGIRRVAAAGAVFRGGSISRTLKSFHKLLYA